MCVCFENTVTQNKNKILDFFSKTHILGVLFLTVAVNVFFIVETAVCQLALCKHLSLVDSNSIRNIGKRSLSPLDHQDMCI